MQCSKISMLVVLHAMKFLPASHLSPWSSLHHPSGHFSKSVWICLILSSIYTWLVQTGSWVGWWFSTPNRALQLLQSWFLCIVQSSRPMAHLRRLILMVAVYSRQRVPGVFEILVCSASLSSVAYAQSNGRAEVAVKTAKRILRCNDSSNGAVDSDKVVRAVLQYRNTPIQSVGLSPAQMLLHRHLCDFLPTHPSFYKPHAEWVNAAQKREEALAERNAALVEQYNCSVHSLPSVSVGSQVSIQNPRNKRWDRVGHVVEKLSNRQYRVRVGGSGCVTLHNRRFLRPINDPRTPMLIRSPTPPAQPYIDPPDVTAGNQKVEGISKIGKWKVGGDWKFNRKCRWGVGEKIICWGGGGASNFSRPNPPTPPPHLFKWNSPQSSTTMASAMKDKQGPCLPWARISTTCPISVLRNYIWFKHILWFQKFDKTKVNSSEAGDGIFWLWGQYHACWCPGP